MTTEKTMFESFLPFYEVMVDWQARLSRESPFFQRVFQSVHARRLLDAACGTGHHACHFARWGLEVCGSDLSEEMIKRSRHLAESQGLSVDFRPGSFDQLTKIFTEPFDAVICTGNSLSAAGRRSTVEAAIHEMARLTRTDGALVLQVLNYELLPPGETVYNEPVSRQHLGQPVVFLKVFRKAGTTCDMDIIVMQPGPTKGWTRTVFRERLLMLDRPTLTDLAERAGFSKLKLYGGYDMSPFDPQTSQDLIIVGRRS